MLRTGEDRRGLRARPLERRLDLRPRRVRQLRGLVSRLLEEPRTLGLRLAQLGLRLGVRLGDDLPRLLVRRAEDLRALPLALLPVALDVRLLRLDVALAAPHLLLGLPELRGRGALRVALERVRELRRRANQMERVHADGVPRRVDAGRPPRRLEHPKLRLELRRVPPERVEGLTHPLAVVPVSRGRQVLEARKRGESRLRRLGHRRQV
jgi:hypothetical protein